MTFLEPHEFKVLYLLLWLLPTPHFPDPTRQLASAQRSEADDQQLYALMSPLRAVLSSHGRPDVGDSQGWIHHSGRY